MIRTAACVQTDRQTDTAILIGIFLQLSFPKATNICHKTSLTTFSSVYAKYTVLEGNWKPQSSRLLFNELQGVFTHLIKIYQFLFLPLHTPD